MAKKISKSQKIGKRAVHILNYKLMHEIDFKDGVEFSFVGIPQDDDYGLDGVLNIFKKKEFQQITPFVQIKGTHTEFISKSKKNSGKVLGYKIHISNKDWNDLKNRSELVILIGVNTKTEQINYVFPKFEEKPESWYIHSFPAENKLEPNQESKQNLFQKIQYFQQEIAKQNQQILNSISLSKGENLPLIKDFEAKTTSSGLKIVSKENKVVESNLSLKFASPEQKKEFKEQFELYGKGLKDKIIFPKGSITNFEQSNGWEIGDQTETLAGDIIFKRPPYYSGSVLLQTFTSSLQLNADYFYSVESKSTVVESIFPKDIAPFWFHIDTNGKFTYQINRNEIKSPVKLFSIYEFLDSLSSQELSVKIKKGYGFKEIFTFTVKGKISSEKDYDLLKCFADVESAFSKTLLENNIELDLPERYDDKDRKAICILGLTLNDMEFYPSFQNKSDYETTKKLKPVGRMDNLYKSVTFQNKKLTIFAGGYGEFTGFKDQIMASCFKIQKPEYIYLNVENA